MSRRRQLLFFSISETERNHRDGSLVSIGLFPRNNTWLLLVTTKILLTLKSTHGFLLRYAPESLRDGKFSTRSDVWSFGVTMYEIFSLGEDPKLQGFQQKRMDDSQSVDDPEEGSSAELLSALEQGARLPCPSKCPQVVYVKLMYPCWNLQSQLRPKFSTLCQDIQELLSEYWSVSSLASASHPIDTWEI